MRFERGVHPPDVGVWDELDCDSDDPAQHRCTQCLVVVGAELTAHAADAQRRATSGDRGGDPHVTINPVEVDHRSSPARLAPGQGKPFGASTSTPETARLDQGVTPLTTRAANGSTGSPPPGRTSRWRWGPVLLPVVPT